MKLTNIVGNSSRASALKRKREREKRREARNRNERSRGVAREKGHTRVAEKKVKRSVSSLSFALNTTLVRKENKKKKDENLSAFLP